MVHQIKCKYCSYIWNTKSEKNYTCCPNCQYKTPNVEHTNVEHNNAGEE